MKQQSGNALFLILIAVALFAALSYAVTQSGRGGGTIDKEQNLITSSQITQHGSSLTNAVTRMLLTGTAATSLDFVSGAAQYGGSGSSPCTSGTDCVFAPDGGGVIWPDPDNYCSGCIHQFTDNWSVQDVGTASADIIYWFSNVPVNLCEQINKGLGLTPTPAEDPNLDVVLEAYPGEYYACMKFSALPNHHYNHVLVAQ